jgi:hypothetical protein
VSAPTIEQTHGRLDEPQVLITEVRRQTRRRRVWIGLAVVAVVTALALLAAGISGAFPRAGRDRAPTPDAPSSVAGVPRPAVANPRTAVLGYYFPRNGADYAAAYSFGSFIHSVQTAAINRCLTRKGFPGLQSSQVPYSGDNVEFPNFPYLIAHGFLVTAAAGASSTGSTAYNHQLTACSQRASSLFNPVALPGSALQSRWMGVVAQIDAGTRFQSALGGWARCTSQAGLDTPTINSFFSLMDGALHNNPGAAGTRYAEIYARCLGPAESVRDHLRQVSRTAFFDSHTSQVNALRTRAAALIAHLSHEYGIKWA